MLTSEAPEMVTGVCHVTEGWAFAVAITTAAIDVTTIAERIMLVCVVAKYVRAMDAMTC